MLSQPDHTVRIPILFHLLQQYTVCLEAVTGIERLLLLIGHPKQAPASLPARLQIGCNLLHGTILQQIVFQRNIQCRRLKRKPQDTVLVQRLSDFSLKRSPEHIIYKVKTTEPQRKRYDNRGPQQ